VVRKPCQQTRFLIDTVQPYAQVLLEYRPSGLIVASYVYGNALISQNRSGVLSYYLVDALGSTRALTNANGVVTDRYVYDAFGRMISQTGNTVNSYLFAGQQWDAATGLDYLRARYLSVETGRFVSKDPLAGSLANPITRNGYVYANLNPTLLIDPSGKQTSLAEVFVTFGIISDLQGLASVALVKGGVSGKVHWTGEYYALGLPSQLYPFGYGGNLLAVHVTSEPFSKAFTGQRITLEGWWEVAVEGLSLGLGRIKGVTIPNGLPTLGLGGGMVPDTLALP